jgi:hypothetical protein
MGSIATHELRHDAGRGVVMAARVGYAAKGVVYSVLGVLALLFVFGEGGRLTDGKGALKQIGELPFGRALLWVTALGLACYALWCLVRAILDPAQPNGNKKRVFKRIGYALAFVWNSSLAVYAGQLARGVRGAGDDSKSYVSELMSWPLGQVGVAIAGAITAGFGLYQIYKAIKNKVGDELYSGELPPRQRRFMCRVARVGVGARGMVFPVIGASLITAALRNEPGRAEGFGEALRKLASQPYGEPLMAFVAAGLLAYGVYQICIARYGRVPQPR